MMKLDPTQEDALHRRIYATEEIKRLQEVIKATNPILETLLEEQETLEWANEDHRYLIVRRKGARPRSTISAQKLLLAGVPAHVIQSCTEWGAEGKPTIMVRRIEDPIVEQVEESVV